MTRIIAVHPDDVEQLLKIRRYLIGYRITNSWTQFDLSRMISGTDGMVYDLESNLTWRWRFSRLQEWPVPFGLKLHAELKFPDSHRGMLTQAIHDHREVAPLWRLSQGASGWQTFQRAYLTAGLKVAREVTGVTPRQMGIKQGVTAKAICNWERDANEIMLPKTLDYARTLGGYVHLELREVG